MYVARKPWALKLAGTALVDGVTGLLVSDGTFAECVLLPVQIGWTTDIMGGLLLMQWRGDTRFESTVFGFD